MLSIMEITTESMTDPDLRQRKDQRQMEPAEWSAFIDALNAIRRPDAPSPTHADFVELYHRALNAHDPEARSWAVYASGHPGQIGSNFLAWHREFLAKYEARLMLVDPTIRLPYWDWMFDRTLPPALSNPADLAVWGVKRLSFDSGKLPTLGDIKPALDEKNFAAFQAKLEVPHGVVHNNLGGDMLSMYSPNDPLFFLHHGNLDKLWDVWTNLHPDSLPPDLGVLLSPAPIMTRSVAEVWRTADLGYAYV